MGNMSLNDAQPPPPSLPMHQTYTQQQQAPHFTGNWNHPQGGQVEDEDEDDEQPLSYSTQQQQQSNYSRPVSVRNMATSVNSAKPANFIKPAAPQSNKSIVPQDMHVIQDLYENYSQKVYLEGYLYKKNDLTVDGKPMGDPTWSNFYVELCGPVLTLWDTTEGNTDENIMPQYINITDSTVELIGRSGEPGRENVFSLNSAGANRYLFDVPDYNALLNWVCAIRLSCFECCRLHEIYTRNFITRSAYSDLLAKPTNKMEGFVQVRFTGTTEWVKYWVVVSDRKEEKKLFGKKSVQSRGQMMFYETKKSKTPVMTMVNIVQAYTIYPESPQLIDLATMLKVEGSTFTVKANGEQQHAAPTAALIMANSPRELVQWIVGTYDAFKLYGRPSKLIEDTSNINSLNFGEPTNGTLPRLFLEVPEVIHVNMRDETLIDNKAKFAGILLQKMQQRQQSQQGNYRQSQQPMGLIHQIPGNQMFNSPTPGNGQRMSVMPGYPTQSSSQQLRSMSNQGAPQPQQRSNAPPGRVIYASDEETEEEEDDEEEEEEDSDNDSIFKPSKNITRESLSLPALSTEDDGFASSILGGIEKKKETAPINSPLPTSTLSSNASLPLKEEPAQEPVSVNKDKGKQPANEVDDFGISDSEDEAPRPAPTAAVRRPKPNMAPTQVSLSGSDDESGSEDEEEDDDDDEGSYSGSDGDAPLHGRHPQDQQHHLQQQQQQQQTYYNNNYQFDEYGNPLMQPQWDGNSMYPDDQAYYDEDGYPMVDEDGPIIPQLGDRFATQNSLLDSYRPDHPSARDQEGYARATGQPLIQVPNKPPEPRAGLVGMISQIEHEKKFKEANKTRYVELEKERLMDRERERYMMEQRAQMMPMGMNMMNQPMMGQPMMDPRMTMMNMQMMGGQMPMMGMMDPRMSMMYSGMNPAMMQAGGSMMNMPMMSPMMDPRMSMMMMQQQYGQYPMWNQQQQSMYANSQFNNNIQEDSDEDDDVPLGAKDSPIPRHNNNN